MVLSSRSSRSKALASIVSSLATRWAVPRTTSQHCRSCTTSTDCTQHASTSSSSPTGSPLSRFTSTRFPVLVPAMPQLSSTRSSKLRRRHRSCTVSPTTPSSDATLQHPVACVGHAVQEATYAYAFWIFARHFCNRLGPAYLALRGVLDESNATHAEVLNNIKRRFREETFTRQSIEEAILAQPDLVRMLYVHFAMMHYPAAGAQASQLMPSLSYQRLQVDQPLTDEELYDRICKSVSNKHEPQIFESFLVFNQCVCSTSASLSQWSNMTTNNLLYRHVLKTNFYQPTKVGLSFRLAPGFLPEAEYPKKPHVMFFVIGAEFRGFHIRFKDIARGGIRIVRSRGKECVHSFLPRLDYMLTLVSFLGTIRSTSGPSSTSTTRSPRHITSRTRIFPRAVQRVPFFRLSAPRMYARSRNTSTRP